MKFRILLDGKFYDVVVSYKSSYRVTLRVVDGIIKVSCPKISIKEIENYIYMHKDELIQSIHKTKMMDFRNNGFVYLFGHYYKIIHKASSDSQVIIRDCDIIVCGNIKVLERELQMLLSNYCDSFIDKFCKQYGFIKPKIEYRKVTSYNGKCYFKENRIVLNKNIIHYKKEYIDFVLMHEMTHFLVHDHSKEFYDTLSRFCPNHKEIKEGGVVYDSISK